MARFPQFPRRRQAPRPLDELHQLHDEALITRPELAELWRVTENSLAMRESRGEGIRRIKIGRLVRYRMGDARTVSRLPARGG